MQHSPANGFIEKLFNRVSLAIYFDKYNDSSKDRLTQKYFVIYNNFEGGGLPDYFKAEPNSIKFELCQRSWVYDEVSTPSNLSHDERLDKYVRDEVIYSEVVSYPTKNQSYKLNRNSELNGDIKYLKLPPVVAKDIIYYMRKNSYIFLTSEVWANVVLREICESIPSDDYEAKRKGYIDMRFGGVHVKGKAYSAKCSDFGYDHANYTVCADSSYFGFNKTKIAHFVNNPQYGMYDATKCFPKIFDYLFDGMDLVLMNYDDMPYGFGYNPLYPSTGIEIQHTPYLSKGREPLKESILPSKFKEYCYILTGDDIPDFTSSKSHRQKKSFGDIEYIQMSEVRWISKADFNLHWGYNTAGYMQADIVIANEGIYTAVGEIVVHEQEHSEKLSVCASFFRRQEDGSRQEYCYYLSREQVGKIAPKKNGKIEYLFDGLLRAGGETESLTHNGYIHSGYAPWSQKEYIDMTEITPILLPEEFASGDRISVKAEYHIPKLGVFSDIGEMLIINAPKKEYVHIMIQFSNRAEPPQHEIIYRFYLTEGDLSKITPEVGDGYDCKLHGILRGGVDWNSK